MLNVNDTIINVETAQASVVFAQLKNVNVVTSVTVEEVFDIKTTWMFFVVDSVVIEYESLTFSFKWLYLNAEDIVSVYMDYVEIVRTPIDLEVLQSVYVDEYVPVFDFIESGVWYDSVVVEEAVELEREWPFTSILRGYPFLVRVKSGIASVEFENGVIQQRDMWGKVRKQFEITFPPMTKSEAMDVMSFYQTYVGTIFPFTNPLDGITYQVRFIEPYLEVERSHFNTFFGKWLIEEVS